MTTPYNLSIFANYLNSSGAANPVVVSDQGNTSTGSLGLPVGTTAQRPASPAAGYTRINTTTGVVEVYYNNAWNTVYTFTPPVPTVIGQAYGGGYYAGQISTTGNGVATHYLIVSPKTTGQLSNVTFGPTGTVTGATSLLDGFTNTATLAALGSTYQAAYQCKNLSIGGYTDWYLPAKFELEILYWYLKPSTDLNWTALASGANQYAVSPEPISTNYTASSPTQTTVTLFQTGNLEAIEAPAYNSYLWSSSQYDDNSAWYQYFGSTQSGKQQYEFKNTAGVARAIRKIPV